MQAAVAATTAQGVHTPPAPCPPPPSAARLHLPRKCSVVHCCGGEGGGVPAQRRAARYQHWGLGHALPGAFGWGGRPHCSSAPQGGTAVQGGSSPVVGGVDLPGTKRREGSGKNSDLHR